MRLLALVLVGLCLVFSAPALANIINVPADYSTIQQAINAAANGDTVLVANGQYFEGINFYGKAILVASNFIYDSLETTIGSTIIDADSLGDADTASVVCFVNGEDSSSIIQGFTIRNGIGTPVGVVGRNGGGIYCYSSSPTIKNNVIADNSASRGAGISCYLNSAPKIHNNTIKDNSADHEGGGIYCYKSSPSVTGDTIVGNSANDGGGIHCYDNSSPEVSYNVISYNYSDMYGAGINCFSYSSPVVSHNIMRRDYSDNDGGAICCYGQSAATITNNTMDRNHANEGAGIFTSNSACVIKNNIVSNSTLGTGIAQKDDSTPKAHVDYNDSWNNAGEDFDNVRGIGNISSDPMFADTTNYALLCTSVCIDAGDPSFDVPDGGGRRIDIGVYEYSYIMGDANSDGEILMSDVVYLSNYVYHGGPPPCPMGAGDCNCDGEVDAADAVYLFYYVMGMGPAPGC